MSAPARPDVAGHAASDRRRYGLLGGWSSRLPRAEGSSLDIVVWNLARALRRRGAGVIAGCAAMLAAATDGVDLFAVRGLPDWAVRSVVDRVSRGALQLRWSSPLHHPGYVLAGVHELRRRRADAILVTHEFANLGAARLVARGVPVVTHLHAVWLDDHPELARRLLQADAVAAVSGFVRTALVSVEPRLERKTFVVRNGVDLDAFPGRAALRAGAGEQIGMWQRRLRSDDRPLILAVVGQVAPEKGLHVLATASAILRDRGVEHVVAIAGNLGRGYVRPGRARHPAWREIERLAQGYPARVMAAARGAHVELLGRLHHNDVRALLAAADVFVSPSLMPEPCPLPALEALAMDLPVVTSDDGGYPELVGDAGLLVPPGDPGALADTLQTLLARAALRDDLARRARRQAARHTWDASAASLAALVDRL